MLLISGRYCKVQFGDALENGTNLWDAGEWRPRLALSQNPSLTTTVDRGLEFSDEARQVEAWRL